MSQESRPTYAFPNLPLAPVPAGTNLLVAGDPFHGTDEVALRMLAAGESRGDGCLLFAADQSGPDLLEAYVAAGGTVDADRMAAVECEDSGSDDELVRTVTSPGDLTGIGIEFSALYEDLYERGVRQVRTGLFSVSTLLHYAEEMPPVYRFLHTLTGRVRAADGFAACVIHPEGTDEQTVRSLAQTFDGRVDVREGEGGREMRTRGLDGQAEGWQAL
ncbi:MAG: hypothetical protein ABEJ30_09525 [Halorientalis sp.]